MPVKHLSDAYHCVCSASTLQPHTYRLDDVLCSSSFPLTSFLCASSATAPASAYSRHNTQLLPVAWLQPVSSQKCFFFQTSNTRRRAPLVSTVCSLATFAVRHEVA